VSETPNSGQPYGVPPTEPVAGSSRRAPRVPDISDLVEKPGRGRDGGGSSVSGRYIAVSAVIAVLVGVAGFLIGHAASSGPKTLAEALTQARAGKLPCGTVSSTSGAGFLVSRLCGSGTGSSGGGGFGGFGPGTVGGSGGFGGNAGLVAGTVSSVSGTSITVATNAGNVTVTVPSTASITKPAKISLNQLPVGSRVVVISSTDASGARVASRVTVSDGQGGGFGGFGGPPVG
jgi:hypothetical protein